MSDATETTGTEVVASKQIDTDLLCVSEGQNSVMLDTRRFWQAQRAAKLLANSTLVPDHFRGKPENCFIGLELADRLGVHALMLMQRMYVVHGKPGLEAQMMIALANAHGPFTGRITWRLEGEGASRKCTALATLADTGETIEAECSVQMAKDMGWWAKKDSMWPKMPDQMLRYRSATFLIRLYCPEVVMGLRSSDELTDQFGGDDRGDVVAELDALEAEPVETKVATVEAGTEPTPKPAGPDPAASDMQRHDYEDTLKGVMRSAGCFALSQQAEDDEVLTDADRAAVIEACTAREHAIIHVGE